LCPNQKAVACRSGDNPSLVENRELVVLDSHAAIRHVLLTNGVKPLPTLEENKELLHDLANSFYPPQMVVYKVR
jgi:hypothetical protein